MPFKTHLKIAFQILLWMALCISSLRHKDVIYLLYQGKGQLNILLNSYPPEEYSEKYSLSDIQRSNIELIKQLKIYSIDSLGYKPTKNFTKIYNQNNKPALWVISASEKNSISPFYWEFPLVGKVSYKGFFKKDLALKEKNHLIASGYDVDLRAVSAWSTLGWFSDPVLSSMLNKPKGQLCNLIFHELFHSTYYAKGKVDFNENLASFIAHKATLRFLRSDTLSYNQYIQSVSDNKKIDKALFKIISELNLFYENLKVSQSNPIIERVKKFYFIQQELLKLNISDTSRCRKIADQIVSSKNAWFVDFKQYNSLQDSLENVFNKNYNSSIRLMVQSLKEE